MAYNRTVESVGKLKPKEGVTGQRCSGVAFVDCFLKGFIKARKGGRMDGELTWMVSQDPTSPHPLLRGRIKRPPSCCF